MKIKGQLSFPGDKSIAHRAIMFAALAKDYGEISNLPTGADVQTTISCVRDCGLHVDQENNSARITGKLTSPSQQLDCGNSGTTVRLFSGLLAGQKISGRFVGDKSLSKRPMNRIFEPLGLMGVKFKHQTGTLPFSMTVDKLNPIEYQLPVPSAQVKSAIILASLGAPGKTVIIEPYSSRDHTENMLSNLGAQIITTEDSITVQPLKHPIDNFSLAVPGDPSSAAFFGAAAALVPNSDIKLVDICLNPTRIGFFTLLQSMGANISMVETGIRLGETTGTIRVQPGDLKGIRIDAGDIPGLIDELPLIAILSTQAEGITEVHGAAELRVKESDRITAICTNLRSMGINVDEFDDGFRIEGPQKLHTAAIQTFSDHRIAMAFSIAGLLVEGKMDFDDLDCIDISFPQFFEFLNRVKQQRP